MEAVFPLQLGGDRPRLPLPPAGGEKGAGIEGAADGDEARIFQRFDVKEFFAEGADLFDAVEREVPRPGRVIQKIAIRLDPPKDEIIPRPDMDIDIARRDPFEVDGRAGFRGSSSRRFSYCRFEGFSEPPPARTPLISMSPVSSAFRTLTPVPEARMSLIRSEAPLISSKSTPIFSAASGACC